MFHRRTLLTGSVAAFAVIALPPLAFASNCGNSPQLWRDTLKLASSSGQSLFGEAANTRFESAMINFNYQYNLALAGLENQQPYHQLDDASRRAMLAEIFAASSELDDATVGLRNVA